MHTYVPAPEVDSDVRTNEPSTPQLSPATCSQIMHNQADKAGEDQKAVSLSASEASRLMRSGRMTVAHYVSSVLFHIQERDPLIRAWVFLDEEDAMTQAKSLDRLPPEERGPLHGVAVGIKDVIAVQGKF